MGPRPIHWPDILTAQGTCENQPSNRLVGADQALKAPEFNHRTWWLTLWVPPLALGTPTNICWFPWSRKTTLVSPFTFLLIRF